MGQSRNKNSSAASILVAALLLLCTAGKVFAEDLQRSTQSSVAAQVNANKPFDLTKVQWKMSDEYGNWQYSIPVKPGEYVGLKLSEMKLKPEDVIYDKSLLELAYSDTTTYEVTPVMGVPELATADEGFNLASLLHSFPMDTSRFVFKVRELKKRKLARVEIGGEGAGLTYTLDINGHESLFVWDQWRPLSEADPWRPLRDPLTPQSTAVDIHRPHQTTSKPNNITSKKRNTQRKVSRGGCLPVAPH